MVETVERSLPPSAFGTMVGGPRVECVPVASLSQSIRERMAALYMDYYDGTSAERFEWDLNEKDEVFLLMDGGDIVGFTTAAYYSRRNSAGSTMRIVFSGDTIVHPGYWGQQALAFRWIERMGKLKRDQLGSPLYWFLIVKGHRTYRFLPAFAQEFWPNPKGSRSDLGIIADTLALEKFGSHYNPELGVVQFPDSRGQLASAIAEPTAREAQREDVRFFLDRNPGYRKGDELVCLCELSAENLKPLGRRIFLKGMGI